MNAGPGNAEVRLALALAFVGGYCDAASFILVGTFTGHVTGNFVLSATKVATGNWRGALAALLAISLFLVGTFLSVVFARRLASYSARFILQVTMGVEIALIVAAYFALAKASALSSELYLVALSLAMGLQNGALLRANGISVHSTVLTGMITTLITGYASAEPRSEGSPERRVLGGIWISFVLGALTGAIIVFRFKEAGVPGAALLLVLIIVAPRAWRLGRP
jgi:uncharacterized membrane protein YoaK (UPF0700 family)